MLILEETQTFFSTIARGPSSAQPPTRCLGQGGGVIKLDVHADKVQDIRLVIGVFRIWKNRSKRSKTGLYKTDGKWDRNKIGHSGSCQGQIQDFSQGWVPSDGLVLECF